jgi:hypothetical protein
MPRHAHLALTALLMMPITPAACRGRALLRLAQ